MFSQLFSKCDQILGEADSHIQQNKKTLQETKAFFPQPEQYVNHTHSFGHVTSFPKASRFKELEKEELKQTDLNFQQTDYGQSNMFQTQTKNFSFSRGQRFIEGSKSNKNQPKTVLYPNFDVTKRNNKLGAVIRQPVHKDLSKSNVSQMTAATLSEVGPGQYFVEDPSLVKKSTAFSKQKRFPKQKSKYEDNPLFINENQTKKRPPSAALIKKKIPKTQKLISKQQQEDLRQRLKMVYWKSIPLQLDRLYKNKSGPILKEKYFDLKKLKGAQKRCAILMMLDRMNYQRGGLDINVAGNIAEEKPCAVVYRKSTPKPFKFSEMQPGPDFYYPQDDLIKPSAVGFSFGRQGQYEPKPTYDDRDYEINEQIFKKGGNIVINPIHQQHRLTEDEIRTLNRGPGFYDCLFKQVEKRDDIGVVKFAKITDKNARENNCVDVKKDINDAVYYPSYEAMDPNVPAPLYKKDADVKPMHIPDKLLFPEHWIFYDGDLNKVRAQIAKNVILAKNMDFKTYRKYTKRFEAFKQYLKSREPKPEAGEYNVKYSEIDPHLEGFEMDKKPEKTLIDPILKQQGEVDGDNLILNPKDFEDHLPNIDFGKTVGRPHLQENTSPDDEPALGDRLLLEPQKPKKKLPDIKFDKMIAREDYSPDLDDENPPQGDVLILEPKQAQRHIAQIDFQKQPKKQIAQPDEIPELSGMEEVVLIDPKPIEKKVKGHVEMARMTNVRMIPILRQNKNKGNEQEGDDEQ